MADYSSLYPALTRKNANSTYSTYGMGAGSGSLSDSVSSEGLDPDFSTNFMGGNTTTSSVMPNGGQSFNYSKLIGAAAPLALSLFAPEDNSNVPGAIGDAVAGAKKLGVQGEQMSGQGAEALGPVLHYLAAINSGDPSALLQATMPERRKIIDQYDTARQQAQFAPRGGGTSAAMVNANTREAGDLASVGAKARSDSMTMAGQLGSNLSQAGANAQSSSVSHLSQLLTPLMQNKENDAASTFKTFSSIAAMMAMFI